MSDPNPETIVSIAAGFPVTIRTMEHALQILQNHGEVTLRVIRPEWGKDAPFSLWNETARVSDLIESVLKMQRCTTCGK